MDLLWQLRYEKGKKLKRALLILALGIFIIPFSAAQTTNSEQIQKTDIGELYKTAINNAYGNDQAQDLNAAEKQFNSLLSSTRCKDDCKNIVTKHLSEIRLLQGYKNNIQPNGMELYVNIIVIIMLTAAWVYSYKNTSITAIDASLFIEHKGTIIVSGVKKTGLFSSNVVVGLRLEPDNDIHSQQVIIKAKSIETLKDLSLYKDAESMEKAIDDCS